MRLPSPYSGVFRGGSAARTGPHALPLACEAPVVFSRACELFVAELTRAAWDATLEGRRRTVHAEDVTAAVRGTDVFDFLVDVVKARPSDDGVNAGDGEGGVAPAVGVHGGMQGRRL